MKILEEEIQVVVEISIVVQHENLFVSHIDRLFNDSAVAQIASQCSDLSPHLVGNPRRLDLLAVDSLKSVRFDMVLPQLRLNLFQPVRTASQVDVVNLVEDFVEGTSGALAGSAHILNFPSFLLSESGLAGLTACPGSLSDDLDCLSVPTDCIG